MHYCFHSEIKGGLNQALIAKYHFDTQTWTPRLFFFPPSLHLNLISLKFSVLKFNSFLCLSPFLINTCCTIFMFSISLSKTECWSAHLLQQIWSWKTISSHLFNHLQNDGHCTLFFSYHWISFWLEHFNNKRYWESLKSVNIH